MTTKKQAKNQKTVKILDADDNIVESTEVGALGMFEPLDDDLHEELEHLQGWREHLRDHDAGAALNFGDY